MHYTYKTSGTCASKIDFEINDGVITDIKFTNGCNGNLKAISLLVDGWTADAISEKLMGNTCGFNSTSCADQLAKAVLAAKEQENA